MGIITIREDFATLLQTIVSPDAGDLKSVSAYPPDVIGTLPLAYLGEATFDVSLGSLEVWTWTIPLTVLVARKANYGFEVKALESVIDAILGAIRSSYTLGGTTMGLNLIGGRQGVLNVGQVPHVALIFTFQIKEKTERTLTV